MKATTRVIIVDDSALMRRVLHDLLSGDPQIEVVGSASNGREAINLIEQHRPDVVIMDVWMPVMNGLEATEYLMAYCPTPILVLTGAPTRDEHNLMFRMLEAGALDVIEKPNGTGTYAFVAAGAALRERIKVLARVRVVTHLRGRRQHTLRTLSLPPGFGAEDTFIVIGASTGGPRTVAQVLGMLPASLPATIMVVQHIARGFVAGFVEWLNEQIALPVHVAAEGMVMKPGHVFVAPDSYDIQVTAQHTVQLVPPTTMVQPSVDIAMRSIAKHHRNSTIGVLLTGMGKDGAAGMAAIRAAGGHTIAQDAATSMIYGMPRAAVEHNAVCDILPVEQIAPRLVTLVGERQRSVQRRP